jgi:hypothetical protein
VDATSHFVGEGEDASSRYERDVTERARGSKWRGRLLLALAVTVVFFVSAIASILFLTWRGQGRSAARGAGAPSNAPQTPAPPSPTAEGRVADAAQPGAEASPAPSPTPEKKDAARAPEAERKALQSALTGWVAATNARDVKRQLAYYAPRLEVFYLSRNVSRDAVLGEKRGTVGRAERVSINVGDPSVEFGRDGLTAVMTFRKKYVIETGGKRRSGEVVQELRWARAGADRQEWRITGERDLRVVR